MTGIYVLKTTQHFYIGLSSKLETRGLRHFYNLKRYKHPNRLLQNVYNKGYKIEFEIIQECKIEDLNRLEILWMDLYGVLHPELKMLNLKSGGNRPTYSYDSRETMSKSKCSLEYDFEKRYLVIREKDEELLYVGTLLDISKTLEIGLQNIIYTNKLWNIKLNCFINIIEELNEDLLDSYYGENYF